MLNERNFILSSLLFGGIITLFVLNVGGIERSSKSRLDNIINYFNDLLIKFFFFFFSPENLKSCELCFLSNSLNNIVNSTNIDLCWLFKKYNLMTPSIRMTKLINFFVAPWSTTWIDLTPHSKFRRPRKDDSINWKL